MPDIWMPARMPMTATTQRMQQRQMQGVLPGGGSGEEGREGEEGRGVGVKITTTLRCMCALISEYLAHLRV